LNAFDLSKSLTIWIPTYRRQEQLAALLHNLDQCALPRLAHVVVSDNDPGGSLWQAITCNGMTLPDGVTYRCNPANLSAGVNFLRAFETCETPWLMIVGDDDLFEANASPILDSLLSSLGATVLAVKFDSQLFGHQPSCQVENLQGYVGRLHPGQHAEAFNNLCFVSNWLFRVSPYRQHLASAYLGYSSKISHLFPLLQASASHGGNLMFSTLQPVRHGSTEGSSWPKAATWYEMAVTLSSFSGFVKAADRAALLRLLMHADWRRYIVKCLRVHQYYGDRSNGVNPWLIHSQLALISAGYRLALMLMFPILLLPANRLPRRLQEHLGDPGCIDRW
jgi:hypothetical protein